MNLAAAYYRAVGRLRPVLAIGYDLLDLILRASLASAFFASGLAKIRDFDSTRALFREEYRVPLLSADIAAVLGTAGELALPVLLALGLCTRAAAAGLFFVNAIAVISYWHVLKDLEPALAQHAHWGTMLLVPLLAGPGRLTLDHWIARRTGVVTAAGSAGGSTLVA